MTVEASNKHQPRRWPQVIWASLVVLSAMSAYELVKQLLWPRISLWESHLITIGFSTLCGGLASIWVTSRLHQALKQLQVQSVEKERLHAELEKTLARLRDTYDEVETLSGLLPVCAWCKQIRDEQGQWCSLESYVSRKTKASVSHSICPKCAEKMKAQA